MMLELLRMKIDNFTGSIDRNNPGRFRGTRALIADMISELGESATIHVPKWGATHVRGTLRDDDKRGNKRHIIAFIDILNQYGGSPNQLLLDYRDCIRAHHAFWESFSLAIGFQKEDVLQKRLIDLLSTASVGRVQQGLVYSVLKYKYGGQCEVRTKKTFAGDDQSSRNGEVLFGDVQVVLDGKLSIAVEVKDAEIDEQAWARVKATHGLHQYALFVLGKTFRPTSLQYSISCFGNTFALHLVDFFLSLVFELAIEVETDPQIILQAIITIYNDDFCSEIEKDDSIKIAMTELPPIELEIEVD